MAAGVSHRLLLARSTLGTRQLKSGGYFGPHPTNLNRRREFRPAYGRYLLERARGGAAIVVSETASVSESDWPYEYAPLMSEAGPSLSLIAPLIQETGSLFIAGLGHSGGQGSSAYSQAGMGAPSPFAETTANELSYALTGDEIAGIIRDFSDSASVALLAGCDGVEINAGQFSLIRQFLSPLTNQRSDEWGSERSLFAKRVLTLVREAAGDAIVGLRLSIDELAPWAGIVPSMAAGIFTELQPYVDYLVVERGSIYSQHLTCPDFHAGDGFMDQAAEEFARLVPVTTPLVVADGRVGVDEAEERLGAGPATLADLTRPLIADAGALTKLESNDPIRPCVACNQGCQVRDPRNPVVSCAFEPDSGHEQEAVERDRKFGVRPSRDKGELMVVGAGLAGMEAALAGARSGMAVRIHEAQEVLGGILGLLAQKGPNARIAKMLDFYLESLERAGITISRTTPMDSTAVLSAAQDGVAVVVATGANHHPRARHDHITSAHAPESAPLLSLGMAEALGAELAPETRLAVYEPTGGPWAMAVIDTLLARGHVPTVVTPDRLTGSQLAPTGDLVPAAQRLAGAGAETIADSSLDEIAAGGIWITGRYSGSRRFLEADAFLDCSLPDSASVWPVHPLVRVIGDALAPRGFHSAVLDARRAVASLIEELGNE